MNDEYSDEFYNGFKVALLITGNYNTHITNEKIRELSNKFVEIGNEALSNKNLKEIPFKEVQTFLKVNGEDFRCECDSYLFTKYSEHNWRCNNCGNEYESYE